MDRNLALESIRTTEAAALAAARLMGRGDGPGARRAAVEAVRKALVDLDLGATLPAAEGETGPVLHASAAGGARGDLDLAIDALEGAELCATGAPNALSIIALGAPGALVRPPRVYMDKLAVGPAARGAIDIRRTAAENLRHVADALGKFIEDLTVVIIDRPRHERLVREVRETGAGIRLVAGGDVAAALATCFTRSGVDVLIGSGGAPEGVLAAAALRCVGGDFQGRILWRSDREREEALAAGFADREVWTAEDLARGEVMFAATGVTASDLLRGVRFTGDGAATHSLVMRSRTRTVRWIETQHHFTHDPDYGW